MTAEERLRQFILTWGMEGSNCVKDALERDVRALMQAVANETKESNILRARDLRSAINWLGVNDSAPILVKFSDDPTRSYAVISIDTRKQECSLLVQR